MITEEEKIKRRKILEMNFNIIASDFDGIIESEVINQPYWEQYRNGDITIEELCKTIDEDIKNL